VRHMSCSAQGENQPKAICSDNAGCMGTADRAEQPVLLEHTTLGQWLRTCASATDLEVASVISVTPSQASSAKGERTAHGEPSAESHE
jgi:hypothetical protein